MIYREFLVMRKAVPFAVGILFAIMMLIALVFGVVKNGHMSFAGDWGDFLVAAAWTDAFFAVIFAAALSSASRDSARVLWTIPKPRVIAALEMLVVDAAGLLVALGGFLLAIILPAYLLSLVGLASFNVHGGIAPLDALWLYAFVLAMYGWAAMVGMAIRRVPYVCMATLPVLFVWLQVAQLHNEISDAFRRAGFLNPLIVLQRVTSVPLTLGSSTLLLLGIALATIAVAVVMWNRAEVIA
jgi:hypothetical protein